MTPEQVTTLRNIASEPERAISIEDLADRSERTLVYGYDVDRNTFHLFVRAGEIRRALYRRDGEDFELISMASGDFMPRACVPNKRAYPERCDFEFCRLISERRITVPFTSFDDSGREFEGPFFGPVFDEAFEQQPALAM